MGARSWVRWVVGAVWLLIWVSACAQDRAGPASGDRDTGDRDAGAPSGAQGAGRIGRVLVFSRTAGFRHPSIVDGRAAFERLAAEHGFDLELTEDPAVFTDAGLAPYQVVVFLHTTGPVLGRDGQAALERWLARGNGWVGVHGAADGDPGWAWYGGLVGARFTGHPAIQPATIVVTDRDHPATATLPEAWKRVDEWYNFAESPRGRARILATLDEGTFEGGTMGDDHPIAWCHEYGGGRAFYTALGHTEASWTEPRFLDHVLGGVRWAAGGAGDCRPR